MLCMNSIISCKCNGIPLFNDNISKKIFEYNNLKLNKNKNELNIITVNGLYGYRTGIVGWISSLCSLYLSKNNNPTSFQRFLNYILKNDEQKFLANDFEILSYFLSLFNRGIPILNYANWDPKTFLFDNFNKIPNLSLSKIYNFNSLYLLNPLFDSGCAIYSNKIPNDFGFQKWTLWNNLEFNDKKFNKGMVWAFYKNENSGIVIINLSLHSCDTSLLYNMQLQQIVKLKKQLEEQFSKGLDNYETYITGDFNTEFNSLTNIEIQSRLNILKEEKLELIRNSEDTSSTHFIFYSNNYNNFNKYTSISNTKIFTDDIINVNFNETKDFKINVCNKISIDDNLNEIIVDNKIFEEEKNITIDTKNIEHEKNITIETKNIEEETHYKHIPEIITNYFTSKKEQKTNNDTNSDWLIL